MLFEHFRATLISKLWVPLERASARSRLQADQLEDDALLAFIDTSQYKGIASGHVLVDGPEEAQEACLLCSGIRQFGLLDDSGDPTFVDLVRKRVTSLGQEVIGCHAGGVTPVDDTLDGLLPPESHGQYTVLDPRGADHR